MILAKTRTGGAICQAVGVPSLATRPRSVKIPISFFGRSSPALLVSAVLPTCNNVSFLFLFFLLYPLYYSSSSSYRAPSSCLLAFFPSPTFFSLFRRDVPPTCNNTTIFPRFIPVRCGFRVFASGVLNHVLPLLFFVFQITLCLSDISFR